MIKLKTKLILLAFLHVTFATSIMAQNEPSSGVKSKHPIKGYRTFIETGLGFNNEGGNAIYVSWIHGGQIIPQLYVGGGMMLYWAEFEAPKSHGFNTYSVDYSEFIPFISVRYDIIPRKVTPYVEGRVGYRLGIAKEPGSWSSSSNGNTTVYYEIEKSDFSKIYLSPSVGVRVRHFNFALSLDMGSVSADVNGVYHKFHVQKNIIIPTGRLSFDFGARR
ncbi:MAG: hypothetical protein E7069_13160 [Bacteroidales bacterium]|jgi:hypothetical protein|nr:hypothetical protein [Bacteroidales bacterium]